MPMKKPGNKFGLHNEGGRVSAASSVDMSGEIEKQTFKKDLIREGEYTHPVFEWSLDVDKERLEKRAKHFSQMKTNGVDVEVVVDHSFSADDVRGYCLDMMVEQVPDKDGELVWTLFGMLEMRGDGIELAQTVKNVSIAVDRNFKDGEGRNYGEVLSHIAIVQQPVVPGQDEFMPIAASGASRPDGIPIMVKKLSRSNDMKLSKEFLEKVKGVLGDGVEITEENAMELMLSRVVELGDEVKTLSATSGNEGTEGNADNTEKVVMDADTAEEVAGSKMDQLSMLVEKGKITPAQKKLCVEKFIGKAGDRNVRCLSIKAGDGKVSFLSQLIEVLKENPTIKGTKTGPQNLELSGAPTGDDEDDDKLAEEMIEEAGCGEDK